VSAVDGHWQLRLEFLGRERRAERHFTAQRCDDLADAAAVALALALSPSASADAFDAPATSSTALRAAAAAAAPPAAPASSAPPPTDAASSAAKLATAASNAPKLELGASALLDPTTLGAVAFGAGLGARARWEQVSVGLRGALLPGVQVSVGSGGQAIDLDLMAAALEGCWRRQPGLDVCALTEVGRVKAAAVHLENAALSRDLWLAPGVGVELSSALFGSLALHSELQVLKPLVRGRFRVDETDVVHQLPVISVRLALGLTVSLPEPLHSSAPPGAGAIR
jgi:hypothetical protein